MLSSSPSPSPSSPPSTRATTSTARAGAPLDVEDGSSARAAGGGSGGGSGGEGNIVSDNNNNDNDNDNDNNVNGGPDRREAPPYVVPPPEVVEDEGPPGEVPLRAGGEGESTGGSNGAGADDEEEDEDEIINDDSFSITGLTMNDSDKKLDTEMMGSSTQMTSPPIPSNRNTIADSDGPEIDDDDDDDDDHSGPSLVMDEDGGHKCSRHDASLSLLDVMLLEDNASGHRDHRHHHHHDDDGRKNDEGKEGNGSKHGSTGIGIGGNSSKHSSKNNSSQFDDSMDLSELVLPSVRNNTARSSASRVVGSGGTQQQQQQQQSNNDSSTWSNSRSGRRGRSSLSSTKFNYSRGGRRPSEGAYSHSQRQESSDNDLSALGPAANTSHRSGSQNVMSVSFHDNSNSLSTSKNFDASTGNMSHRERRALRTIISSIDAELSEEEESVEDLGLSTTENEGSFPRNSLHGSRHSNGSRGSRRRRATIDDDDDDDHNIPTRAGAFHVPGRNNGSSSNMTDAATGILNDSGTIATGHTLTHRSSRQRVRTSGKIDEVGSDDNSLPRNVRVAGSNGDDEDEPTVTSTQSQDDVMLLEAQLVEDDIDPETAIDRARQAILYDAAVGEVIDADEVYETEQDRLERMEEEKRQRRRRRCIWGFMILLVVIVVAAVGAVVGASSDDPAVPDPTPAPTSQLYASLEDALSVPMMADFVDIEKILSSDEDSLQTPESLAFQWMTEEDQYDYVDSSESSDEMIQRFVVASLYFEWIQGGELFHLGNRDVFLSSRHVCDWNGIDPDTDQPIGIFCTGLDNDHRVVTGIVMPKNNAGGSGIPTIVGYLSNLQEISMRQNRLSEPLSETAMGYLSDLRVLDLSSNMIPAMIPTTIGIMTSLEALDLHTNSLSSVLPSEIGLNRKLQRLDLFENNITSTIPSEIGQLTGVHTLRLNDNLLSGPLPVTVGMMTSLESMILTNNMLSAAIPSEIGSLSLLKELRLDANQHTGLIPTELGGLQTLFHLRLDRNRLTGQVPVELSRMAILQSLVLYWNDLTGDMSSLFCPTYYPVIAVDCGGQDPKVTCTCCNVCCNSIDEMTPDEMTSDENANSAQLYCK